ncbi:MAG: glycoside hydrolase family 44 protein, partial [Terracidiphilus sp.]|nr:glycoside hydrolase family 44 protein [Terracidiphilus sp.]
VTPASATVTSAQTLSVTITVGGNPTPTGSVTLGSGKYASGAASLAGGSAIITLPAGSLATGNDTLTASYTPDAASSSTYNSASGSGPVTVTAAVKATPSVSVTTSAGTVTNAQSLVVTVMVGGGSGNPTPTGTVTLSSGTYNSTATPLAGGSASITIPAGSLATGNDTLTASYTPDAASASTYTSASGTGSVTVTAPPTYVLTVDSAAPSNGVLVQVSPADMNSARNGTAPFTRTYNAGTQVTLSVAMDSGIYSFVSWGGCTTTSGTNCSVTMNRATTVTATYNQAQILSIGVSPNTATIGTQQQFTATVSGTGSYSKSVSWSLTCPLCGGMSPGTLSASGLYTTPYPAPASVTVTATSTSDTSIHGSAIVTLSQPAAAAGPALTVDAGNPTHAINPFIYGWNGYSASSSAAKAANITVDRFGGDATSRYNYQLDVTSSASDWWFENQVGNNGQEATSQFNEQVIGDASVGARTLGTVGVLGWVAKDGTSCSFPRASYPSQYAFDPYSGACGDGELPNQTNITGNDPTLVATQAGPAWAGDWVAYLVSKFGTAANGGVYAYDLDNEPAWWDAVHRDVHPVASTYDEVTNNGIATALAIKAADPTAQVNGPVVDYWWNYFYSKKDIEAGWNNPNSCYQPWDNPTDRQAHLGVPFIEYYLQKFNAAETTNKVRLLDYLDLHTYFAATYNGSGVGLTTAGDTGEQEARLNSTRVFWDPTYTDPNFPQPNYTTDSNYTSSCNVPLQAPQLIPMAQAWVAKDYPGTKIAFTEYNWGGQENINGAVAQADILGIFGNYGLDMATLWGPPDPTTQVPGLMAYEIYRNYDGKNSMFGDIALASTSVSQGALSVYGALRTFDNAITVMVINKTYGDLTSTITLANFTTTSTTAQAYLYSNANLNVIVAEPNLAVTPPGTGATASTITTKFPAQSITLLVVPQ